MTRSLYFKVAALLLCITLLSAGVTALTAPRRDDHGGVRVVTSFYPVYIAALNVAGGIDGVEVVNMVNGQYGCLHDYQMSPADRVTLDSADILVMNGAGAEPFLSAALAVSSPASVIDLSKGIALLESGHVHEHDGHDHDHVHEDAEAAAVNDHLWMSPLRYRQQIENLRDGLIAADPAHAAAYTANAAAYIDTIDTLWVRLQAAVQPFTEVKTVLFHDSLAYLAEDLGLRVAAALNVGEDSGVSAAALSAAEDALAGEATAMFLYDSQYDTVGYTYLQDIPAQSLVLSVDTCVAGEADADRWCEAMTALCQAWEAGRP